MRLYISDIQGMAMRYKVGDGENVKWVDKFNLPKPKKRIMRGIIRGDERYNDYELLTKE